MKHSSNTQKAEDRKLRTSKKKIITKKKCKSESRTKLFKVTSEQLMVKVRGQLYAPVTFR